MPHPFTPGNRVTLLTDGTRTFELALDAIAGAKTRVWLEAYIFEPDEAGKRMLKELTDAASRGVDVILLVDRFGSYKLRDRHVRPLRAAGGVAAWFNPLFGVSSHGRKVSALGVHRDHRKILIVDDGPAFTGGRNVSMDYGGTGDDVFYDVMVAIEGPAVRELGLIFLETLDDTSDHTRELFAAPPPAGDTEVRALQLDLRERVGELDHAVVAMVAAAQGRVLFCTPYFIPPAPLLDALLAAAERGVDVRVLTAGKSDVPAVTLAGRYLYPRLHEAGIRVFEMTSHPLHAKFVVADDQYSIVGSYNFDRWGQRFNQEVAVEVVDFELATRLASCFDRGAQHEVLPEQLHAWRRAGHAVLYGASQAVAPGRSLVKRRRRRRRITR
jgi:cardiolipin synthase A/B